MELFSAAGIVDCYQTLSLLTFFTYFLVRLSFMTHDFALPQFPPRVLQTATERTHLAFFSNHSNGSSMRLSVSVP